ncbi:MAG: palindromic element RPE4 domain-containing protein [Rickettsia endosymbiont of Graphium doson]|nr:palindromic element RPE4 domain-containing protein [Rickettsia endosymbiont of Graphium doson]
MSSRGPATGSSIKKYNKLFKLKARFISLFLDPVDKPRDDNVEMI